MAGEIQGIIRRRAAELGIDPAHLLTMASIETGGTFDPRAGAGKRYQGLFQFGPNEWKTYGGGGDIFDPLAQINAAHGYSGAINGTLKQTLGRDPSGWEQYLGWQQGASGASGLLSNPDKAAWKIVGRNAVKANLTADDLKNLGGNVDTITAKQFADVWQQRYIAHNRAVLGRSPSWQGEGDSDTGGPQTTSPSPNDPPRNPLPVLPRTGTGVDEQGYVAYNSQLAGDKAKSALERYGAQTQNALGLLAQAQPSAPAPTPQMAPVQRPNMGLLDKLNPFRSNFLSGGLLGE